MIGGEIRHMLAHLSGVARLHVNRPLARAKSEASVYILIIKTINLIQKILTQRKKSSNPYLTLGAFGISLPFKGR